MRYWKTAGTAALLWLTACASGLDKTYVDPGVVPDDGPALTFNPTDLQKIAEKMTQSLVETKVFDGQDKPIIRITQVKNKTDEHIDTKMVTDKIRTVLIKSGKIRFTADKSETEAEKDMLDEFSKQRDDSHTGLLMKEESKLKMGKMKGPKYHLYGEIAGISNFDNRAKDVFYKITLNLMNLEEGILEWSEEKELRKIGKRKLFGM